ncbi:PAS domain S-box protein [Flavobacteriaceae bacterium F08102]|nr:PAS domain S-box protein [Flavobacteriaceae bacterium F08102]
MENSIEEASFLQHIFEASIEGIMVVDEDGIILKANPASERMFSYQKGELLNEHIEVLIPQSYRELHENHRECYRKNPKARVMRHNLGLIGLRKDGSHFPVEISLSPTKVNGRNLVTALLIDITERVLAEQKLRMSEYNLAKAQSITHIGSWDWNLVTNERRWSDEYYRICGLTPGDSRLSAEKPFVFVHPDDRLEALNRINEAIKTKTTYNFEKRIIRPDGSLRYVIANGTATYNEQGKPVHLYGTMQDITSVKQSERQSRDIELKNRAMLQAIPDLIVVFDAAGTYLDIHATDPKILPVPIDQLLGKTIWDIHSKERCERIMKAFAASKKTKEVQIVEFSNSGPGPLKFYEVRVVSKENGNFLAITRDITAKKITENTLRIRDRALACAGSGIVITDVQQPDTPVIYANDAFLKTTGYDLGDVIGHNCRFLQGKDQDQEGIDIMSTAIKNGESCTVVLRNYKKDGSLFWNEISLTPVYDSEEHLTHFISVQNDISTRKREEFYKNGVNRIMDMIIQHRPLKQIGREIIHIIEETIPNSMASILLLNYEKMTLEKLAAPNIPIEFSKAIDGVEIGSHIGSCGTSVFFKEAVIVDDIARSPLWTSYRDLASKNKLKSCWSFPIFSSDEEVLGTFAVYAHTSRTPKESEIELIRDITRVTSLAIEQHNVNKALQQNTEELAAYADRLAAKVEERTDELKGTIQKLTESNISLEDQIQETKEAENEVLKNKVLLDNISHNFPRGFIAVVDKDFTIVLIAGEEVHELGFDHYDAKKMSILEVEKVPKDIKTTVLDKIKNTFKGAHCSFEISFQERFYLVNTTPLYNDEGHIEKVLLVHNNITLQKEAELELLNVLNKEQELSELKSRFISMASHEFRTPLSAILTSAILIEKQNEVGKEERRLSHVSKIRMNVKNLVLILNDFLSLSKLEEGKVVEAPVMMELIEFSKDLIEEINVNKKEGQYIELVCEPHPIEVCLDPKLLRHIVYNLLSNAIKYSEENTKITIEIKRNDQYICLEITDEGMGIPKENQVNLFNRFYRADNVTHIQGTGLGLNIVKQYTELMGGTITFKSELQKGSTFYVTLPLKSK